MIIKGNFYCGLDILKFLMCFFVVKIHVGTFQYCGNSIINFLAEAAVPTFFVVSGFLFELKYQRNSQEKRNISFWKQMCNYTHKYLTLFLIWTILYLPLSLYDKLYAGESLVYALCAIIKNVIVRGHDWMSWSLWYLPAVVVSILYLLILKRYKISTRWCAIIGFCSGILTYFLSQNANLPFLRVYLAGFCYVSLGCFLAQYSNKIKIVIPIICLILSFAVKELCPFLSVYLSAYALVVLFVRINFEKRPIFIWMKQMSSLIYLTHLWVFAIIWFVWDFRPSFYPLFGITILSTLVVSAIIIRLSQTKYLAFLKKIY